MQCDGIARLQRQCIHIATGQQTFNPECQLGARTTLGLRHFHPISIDLQPGAVIDVAEAVRQRIEHPAGIQFTGMVISDIDAV